jgi:hypothetical protein
MAGATVKHEQIPVQDQVWMEDIDDGLFRKQKMETHHSEQHKKNLLTFWFSASLQEGTVRFNNNLYADIILSSAFTDRKNQFPSLVSFIGATGAGKSVPKKAIIDYGVGANKHVIA